MQSNPVTGVERPWIPRQRWRILEPHEVPRVFKAFSDDRARRVFLTLALTGVRRSELVGLRWKHVNLVERTLRVEESKSEEGERLIALPRTLVVALAEQFTSSPYWTDEDFVFAHPERGTKPDASWYRGEFLSALAAAGVEGQGPHLPRHAAHRNHEPGCDRREPDRGHGDRGSSLHGDDEGIPTPGRRRLPGRSSRARAAAIRSKGRRAPRRRGHGMTGPDPPKARSRREIPPLHGVGLLSVDVTRVIERLRFVRHHRIELLSDETATLRELQDELDQLRQVQDAGTKSLEAAVLSRTS